MRFPQTLKSLLPAAACFAGSLTIGGAVDTILIDEGAPATALIPSTTNGGSTLGESWLGIAEPPNAAEWLAGTTGVGYEVSANNTFDPLIGLDVIAANGVVRSVFARIPFELDAAALADVRTLTLRMKYDDGFVAWINGVQVASANAPAEPAWDSGATSSNPDSAAQQFEDFNADRGIDALVEGTNVLAIQIMNSGVASSDLLASPQLVASDEVPPVWPDLRATQIASGLSRPVDIQHAGDGAGRLFIVEKLGRIRIYKDGLLQSTGSPFLNITSRVDDGGNEEGLLGLAFPPSFATDENPHFYVYYTVSNGTARVSRFFVSSGDPDLADASSEEILMTVPQPFSNHNGGQLQFGPLDGYLYLGLGDGGSGGDPGDRSQNGSTLLGKMIRIDVQGAPDPGLDYAIPTDNPFRANGSIENEIWALGLRNPWRFSFDRKTGDMWIADVGQNAREEVNFQPGDSPGGENYGWRYFEASNVFSTSGRVPSDPVPPAYEYVQSSANGRSITGGYVYRGARHPRMEGIYFYIDYQADDFIGLQGSSEDGFDSSLLLSGYSRVTTFGEDEAGELYFATDSSSNLPNRVFLLSDTRDSEFLKFTSVAGNPEDGIDLEVGTEIGGRYQLQETSDLDNWADVGGVVTADGLRTPFSVPGQVAPDERKIFRVIEAP